MNLRLVIESLMDFIQDEEYRGHDPYDGLSSPATRRLVRGRWPRFVFQQAVLRSVLNLRPVLRIPKGLNPVTLGQCLEAYAFLGDLLPGRKEQIGREARTCRDQLMKVASPEFPVRCWGYDFDWEGKYLSVPAHGPTVVATALISTSFYQWYRRRQDDGWGELCIEAGDFVLNYLHRSEGSSGLCFSYSPYDRTCVLNASMFGARILTYAYHVAREERFISSAKMAVDFVVGHQRPDGSWPYAVGDARQWIDNFHTGYILESLSAYLEEVDDPQVGEAYRKGMEFYLERFFDADGLPRFTPDSRYPIDSTVLAQSIRVLLRSGEAERARLVARLLITLMRNSDGSFAYRKHRMFVDRTPFMRWSQAPVLAALAGLLYAEARATHRPGVSAVGETADRSGIPRAIKARYD